MANRTLQFYGYAYGASNVQLNAHINGTTVFSGSVPTIDQPLPLDAPDMTTAPVLFTVDNSSLVPTEFEGSLPMTVSVATGDGVVLGEIFCNYMDTVYFANVAVLENSSVSGNTLTVGTIASGTPAVGQLLWYGDGSQPGTFILGANRAPDFYFVDPPMNLEPTTITCRQLIQNPGNAAYFMNCFDGSPTNSDGTGDPRSSVTIDDVAQNPARDGFNGTWAWIVPQGSTIACNLNVSVGNVA